MGHPQKKDLLLEKLACATPPHANFGAYTPGLCVQRCNWPLGAVFTGPEGALIARRTPGKREGVEFTQAPKYDRIQRINRV